MTIFVKNKHTLQIDEFKFKCCIGKKGFTINKKEGDQKTPKGILLKCVEIKKDMGWCDDVSFPKKYNRLFKIKKRIKHEKLMRKDNKYDLLIPIKYNFSKPVIGLGSCIFIHLTKNYKPTAGCVALKKKDFFIMLKLLKKNSKIEIL